VIRYKFQ